MTRAVAVVLLLSLASCVHERTKVPFRWVSASGGSLRSGSDPKPKDPPANAISLGSDPKLIVTATAGRAIEAVRASVYVPAARAGDVALTAASIERDASGRRTATGRAVFRLGDLTVSAERVTVVVKPPGDADLQVSARGNVSYRSQKGDARVEETGLKSLLLTNDAYVPLR